MRDHSKRFSVGEERANAISHGVGAFMCLGGLAALVLAAKQNGGTWHLVSAVVFGCSLLVLYLSSTFNHSLPAGKAKDFFHNFDQMAIYVLIAGTYTPFALIALNGTVGWAVLGAEWVLAAIGIGVKIRRPNTFEAGVGTFAIVMYLTMGWIVVFAIRPLLDAVPGLALVWLLAGGAFYTGGIAFFKTTGLRYHHLVWHLFVIGGSVCHFVSIYKYILPIDA